MAFSLMCQYLISFHITCCGFLSQQTSPTPLLTFIILSNQESLMENEKLQLYARITILKWKMIELNG